MSTLSIVKCFGSNCNPGCKQRDCGLRIKVEDCDDIAFGRYFQGHTKSKEHREECKKTGVCRYFSKFQAFYATVCFNDDWEQEVSVKDVSNCIEYQRNSCVMVCIDTCADRDVKDGEKMRFRNTLEYQVTSEIIVSINHMIQMCANLEDEWKREKERIQRFDDFGKLLCAQRFINYLCQTAKQSNMDPDCVMNVLHIDELSEIYFPEIVCKNTSMQVNTQ